MVLSLANRADAGGLLKLRFPVHDRQACLVGRELQADVSIGRQVDLVLTDI